MTFPKARLAVSACLFLSWLGFLLYLVIESRTIVLSKPQFMIAQVYAVISFDQGGRGGPIEKGGRIVEILWSADPNDEKLAHQAIELPEVTWLGRFAKDWSESEYLVPLQKTATGQLEIAPVPHASGYRQLPLTHGTVESFGVFSHRVLRRLPFPEAIEIRDQLREAGYVVHVAEEELRIYPVTADTRAQVAKIIAGRK